MSDLLQSIVQWAIGLLRADAGEIYLWDQTRGVLVLSVSHGFVEAYTGITLRPGEGLAGRVLQTGTPMVIDDYLAWEGRSPAFTSHPPFMTMLAVRMEWQERKIGVLVIDADVRRRTFDQNDVQLATLFANVAAIAIENVQLYTELQERSQALQQTLQQEVAQRTAELAHRALQLETSAKVSRELTSILVVDKLLTRVVELIHDAFGYYRVKVFLVEPESDQLVLRASSDRLSGLPEAPDNRLAITEGSLNGEAAWKNQAILVKEVAQPSGYGGEETAPNVRSELVSPLRVAERVLGTLDVQSDRVNAFSPEDMLVIQSLADQVAIAIDNAELYDHSRQLAILEERNRLARDLHDAVTQTLFSASLIADVIPDFWGTNQPKGLELLKRVRQLNRSALAEMRTLLLELRPEALADANLGDLLRQLAETISSRTGIAADVVVDTQLRVPPDVQVALYRIAQEALNNIARHAQASQVSVSLQGVSLPGGELPQMPGVQLCIADNGHGFDPKKVPANHLGLRIICERAESIGGLAQIASVIGRGTEVRVTWRGLQTEATDV